MTRRRTLSDWIAWAMVAAVVAATLVQLVIVQRFAHANAIRTTSAVLNQIAWQMRDQLDRGMSARYEEITVLASLRDLRPGAPAQEVRSFLDKIKYSYPKFAWLGYVDHQGTVVAGLGGLLEGKNVGARPWFGGALHGPYIGDVHPAVLLEKLLPQREDPWRFVDVAMPIRAADGSVANVFGAHLSWEWARELRRNLLAPARKTYGVEIFVVDRSGKVLLGPKGLENKPIAFAAYDALRKEKASDPLQTWNDGVSYATAVASTQGYGHYPGLGWVVVVRQPQDIALADYDRLQHQLIVGAVCIGLIAVCCAPMMARRLTAPLAHLTRALEQRAQGRIVPIPLSTAYGEAELLSRALGEFAERERQHVDELQRVNEKLEQRVEERTAEMRASRQRLRAIADNLPALIAEVDRDLHFLFVNRAYEEWFGVNLQDLLGRPLTCLYGEATVAEWAPHLEQVWRGERTQFERVRIVDGKKRYELATYLPRFSPDGEVRGFYALISDQTARKEMELRLQNEAAHDALTGLPNRRHLTEQLPQAIARADRLDQALALLFLDLNGFKNVNDTHGHEAGDELLQQVASRLQGSVRKGDTVVRLAGDEFVVLLEPIQHGLEGARRVVAKIDEAIERPFELALATVRISVSTGISVYEPGSRRSIQDLMSGADTAMYEAKKMRKGARSGQGS